MAKLRIATAITGACGEHYIAGYLSGHHLIVAMPRGGIPGSDLFVSKEIRHLESFLLELGGDFALHTPSRCFVSKLDNLRRVGSSPRPSGFR